MLTTKKKLILAGCLFVIVLGFVALVAFPQLAKAELSLVPQQTQVPVSSREEFVVDVCLSDLPDENFPAASISVEFDKNKLEFTGVRQGTMRTEDGNGGFNIPEWSCNSEVSNRKGQINAMYLDMTAGDLAYVQSGYDKNGGDVMLRLSFKLRDSAVSGESYELSFLDASIAAVDGDKNNTSLASTTGSLRTRGCNIKVN